MVTQDVDFVVAAECVGQAIELLKAAGFSASEHPWSVNFTGSSKVSIQLSTEGIYLEFPARSVVADVHGILLRVASLEDTLHGKILAWDDVSQRQSKRMKDLTDITRLVETHPQLWSKLPANLQRLVEPPKNHPNIEH